MTERVFINRRTGKDRRSNNEQRQNPRLDLQHRRRRSEPERRARSRQLSEDFQAFQQRDSNRYRRH